MNQRRKDLQQVFVSYFIETLFLLQSPIFFPFLATIVKTTRDVPTQTTMTFYDGIKYMEQTQLLFKRMMGPLAAKINRVEAVVNPKRAVFDFPLESVDGDQLAGLVRTTNGYFIVYLMLSLFHRRNYSKNISCPPIWKRHCCSGNGLLNHSSLGLRTSKTASNFPS